MKLKLNQIARIIRNLNKFKTNFFSIFLSSCRGRKLNLHLERAIQKAMIELDKQPLEENSIRIHNNIKSKSEKICKTSIKTSKSKMLKIAPALSKRIEKY